MEAKLCELVSLQKAAEQVLVHLPHDEPAAKSIAAEVSTLQAKIAEYVSCKFYLCHKFLGIVLTTKTNNGIKDTVLAF